MQNNIQKAIHDIQLGKPIAMTDDADRENEADLIIAAEKISTPLMAMMIRYGSGIVCLCLDKQQAEALALKPMVANNQSKYHTNFTQSIEATSGVTTGVSAQDRVTTIRTAISKQFVPGDIVSPGHVFPLISHPSGVLGRRGHTESSVDLVKLANLKPAAVLCELMNDDGTMMKGIALDNFIKKHQITKISIAEISNYRQQLNLKEA
ncbi:3,4-dihydroxy-2-butanone-4-phosphate synthase [Neisseriaceae bacterium PsAf]|nr:3,4-dihydroxy-2-butanone-4-phosphate synthase [Neisseriaceae bacterium PsAf]MCV2502784.1 3,4-dihydroxy-2-butanone-4-phosphate synthase [Neisseriaceae bacterium]